MKKLPFIAIPSKTLPDVLRVIAECPPGESPHVVARALAEATGNAVKTTVEYLRSLRRLQILEDNIREVHFTPSGIRIWEEMRAGSWKALKEHLEHIPEVRDLLQAASKVLARGNQLVQSESYYKLVASVMESEFGYSRVSPRRVDNYLSLFKQCGLISDQFAGVRVFVPSEIRDHLELAQLLKLIFAEAKQNNPVFEKIPYIPIEDVENLLVSESRITPERLWSYLVRLWQEDRIELLQTKLSIANQLGIRTYSADGFLFTSIGLRDGDKIG